MAQDCVDAAMMLVGDDIAVSVIFNYTNHHSCKLLSQKQVFFGMLRFPVNTVKLLTSTRRSGYFEVQYSCKALT